MMEKIYAFSNKAGRHTVISGKILYLIFDYPHKYNTFKHFDV